MDNNCLLLAFNYIQKTSYEPNDSYYNPRLYKNHILYEASVLVVNMSNGFCNVDKSAFHFPLKNIYTSLHLKADEDEMISDDDDDDLNKCLELLVTKFNVKYAWVYGINQILFKLPVLQYLTVFNIRSSTIYKFGEEIKLDEYSIPKPIQVYNKRNNFPPPSHSITNLCQMLSKNLIRGYQDSLKTINFYADSKKNPDCRHLHCSLHFKATKSNSTCACLLNEINRLILMFLSASQDLYLTEYKEYIKCNPNHNERFCQFMAGREVEFKLQTLLLSMIYPEKFHWDCYRNENGIYVSVKLIDYPRKNIDKYKLIKWQTSQFSKLIMTEKSINHRDSNFIQNIMIFLGFDEIYNVHLLP